MLVLQPIRPRASIRVSRERPGPRCGGLFTGRLESDAFQNRKDATPRSWSRLGGKNPTWYRFGRLTAKEQRSPRRPLVRKSSYGGVFLFKEPEWCVGIICRDATMYLMKGRFPEKHNQLAGVIGADARPHVEIS